MSPLHYIIFHPEKKRQAVTVRAQEVADDHLEDWSGDIWVDRPPGNEDPFVFHDPWLYSFCHATQLRREPNAGGDHVQPGSVLLFCCGQRADAGALVVDTVFVVGRVVRWPHDALPDRYMLHRDGQTDTWRRHLRFGVNGAHEGAFTYEAQGWQSGATRYSFFPLAGDLSRVSIAISDLPKDLAGLIVEKCVGKRPVELREDEMEMVIARLEEGAVHRVVGCPVTPPTAADATDIPDSSSSGDDGVCC